MNSAFARHGQDGNLQMRIQTVASFAFASWIPGCVFLFASISKAWDPSTLASLWTRLGIGSTLGNCVLLGLVFFEGVIGLHLLLLPQVGRSRLIAIISLVLFCVFLIYLSTLNLPPSCGCLGAVRFFKNTQSELYWGIARNAFLIAGMLSVPFAKAPR